MCLLNLHNRVNKVETNIVKLEGTKLLNFVFDNNITLDSLKMLTNQINQQLEDNTSLKSQRSQISRRFVNPLSQRGRRTRTKKYFSNRTNYPRTRFATNILSQTTGFINPLQTLRVAAGIKKQRPRKRTRQRPRKRTRQPITNRKKKYRSKKRKV